MDIWTALKDPYEPVAIPTIAKNATDAHHQQSNKAYGEECQIFENVATMDKSIKHQIIETIEDTYIVKLCNKYTYFVGVNTVDLFHPLMDRYGKIIETSLKENQKISDEAMDTTVSIDKYFEQIDDCIQYVDYSKQPHTAAQIINNSYNMI